MCRLLGYTAPNATTFNDVVGANFDEFINLSTDHCDGWGIASSESNKASLYKEPVAANKSSHFKDEISSHKSNAALLHLRWATEGMAVNENNTHPFTYEGITFIHNGSITPPTALDSVIDKKYLELVKGNTDSERYFLYLLTQIEKHGFIEGVKKGLTYIKANCSFSSINMMIINEAYFIAACIYNQDKIPQKFIKDTDYYHLKYTKRDGQVVVASSGWNQDGWEEIPNGSVLVVERGGQESQLEVLN